MIVRFGRRPLWCETDADRSDNPGSWHLTDIINLINDVRACAGNRHSFRNRIPFVSANDGSTLTSGFFFGLMRLATVFIRLLRISGRLPGHVARIEMILAVGIFARLLHVGVFIVAVGHVGCSFRRRNNIQQYSSSLVPNMPVVSCQKSKLRTRFLFTDGRQSIHHRTVCGIHR